MLRKRVCVHCDQPITYKQAFNALDFGREEHVRLKDCVDGLKALLTQVRDTLDRCETAEDIENLRNLLEKP